MYDRNRRYERPLFTSGKAALSYPAESGTDRLLWIWPVHPDEIGFNPARPGFIKKHQPEDEVCGFHDAYDV